MKKTLLTLVLAFLVMAGFLAFRAFKAGTVKGMITPVKAASVVWVLSTTDTLRGDIVNGGFEVGNVKPGMYKLVVEAVPPYKTAVKEGLMVQEGGVTDVGEIKLDQ
ncbi:carboxypeptidase-like regulatory domain-containing protein [Sediminibacterium ginsengisoli]|uniref:Carboxypeptidase regulatory-like domain-containing protein n=1 Tax=Sediminibacterium ginsengisoli TaxID=413434 RepID=A0A1T4PKF9_9BACT|nr:carboxypeptidase-like regulatory domain-containing protein [Sediminibacterium ginsengisoli]SJZ91949.1 hypothetical protein SAMN04488132_10653 [Sediminibacterium ginsengisoli]